MIAEASGSFAYIIVPTMLRCDIVPARNCLHMVTVFLAKRQASKLVSSLCIYFCATKEYVTKGVMHWEINICLLEK